MSISIQVRGSIAPALETPPNSYLGEHMKKMKGLVILATILIGVLQPVRAMELRLTDPNSATSVVVGDGGSGSLFYSGPVGPTWIVSIDVGLNLGDPLN